MWLIIISKVFKIFGKFDQNFQKFIGDQHIVWKSLKESHFFLQNWRRMGQNPKMETFGVIFKHCANTLALT